MDAGIWVKAKSKPFEAGLGREATLGGGDWGLTRSKKFPPLKAGGEVTFGAAGVDLGGGGLVKPLSDAKAEEVEDWRGSEADVLEKSRPLNASLSPPKESFPEG